MNLKIFKDIDELVTLSPANQKQGRNPEEQDLGIIKKAAMVSYKGQLLWRGPQKSLSKKIFKHIKAQPQEISLKNHTVLPSFTECHTHLIFAGDRKNEFEMRNQGKTYQEISQAGGGILSTVKATRKASKNKLIALGQQHLNNFIKQGVTTVEVKSGYALDLKNEVKMLEAAKSLTGARVVSTFLGLHAVPPEFKDATSYFDFVCKEVLPVIKKKQLAERVDLFIEKNYFSGEQANKYFKLAHSMGFALSAHTDQLSRSGEVEPLIQHQPQSLDHLVQISQSDAVRLAASKTVNVLLPTADFYLQMAYPPARDLIDQGGRVALATDFNPGSSPTQNLSFVGVLARLEMKMSLVEVILAYTLNAAAALGKDQQLGSLDPEKYCDFISLDGSWQDLFYHVGHHPVASVWTSSKKILKKDLPDSKKIFYS